MEKKERNKIKNALVYPVLFVLLIGLVHLIQYVFEVSFTHYGIYPRSASGLIGIISSPLIHGSFNHLFNNSVPLLIMGSLLFYFYKEIASKVSVWIYLMVGVWTWIYAREAYHIGASGVLYGLFSFLLISGFIRRNKQLIALSFSVVFLYGSMVWGLFPIDIKVSFEAHIWGFVAGIILAVYYRKRGPQKVEHIWEEEDIDEENKYWLNADIEAKSQEVKVNYVFKPEPKKENPPNK
ncbi:MAG: rhomboid family intramembrane serine protease [Vicingaceae bacterium]